MADGRYKETDADRAVKDSAYRVTAAELRQIVERIEGHESDKGKATAEIASVLAEAKARGYSTKAIKQLVARRKRKPDELAEEQAVLDLYVAALDEF